MVMIEVERVSKFYDTIEAVSDFSLTVAKGQTLGLIGPNGSGKTTLLRMIATLAKPDAGRIRVAGIDGHLDPAAVRRHLAFMPAEFGCPGEMTIEEYMHFFACAAGVDRNRRAPMVDDVLELTDLADRRDLFLRGLSTGNKQRVLLAKTLLGDADLLLLDEPASGLDPRARAEVRSLLRELAKMGKTIVVSSHILADLEDICDAICIIERGERIAAGTLEDLRRRIAQPHRLVHLRVQPERLEAAKARLAALPEVLTCEVVENRLTLTSVRGNCNYILQCLIEGEIEILEMREETPDLEDIFLQTTQGVVS